jgi:hypothetical protein
VVDLRWRGTLACSAPIAGVAFLVRADEAFWVKSAPAALVQPVEMSLHAYEDYSPEHATFVGGMGGSILPGVPVPCAGDLAGTCTIASTPVITGRAQQLAQTGDAAFYVFLLPGRLLRVARHRLWRVRDELASTLPSSVREILTRRRSGTIR